MDNEERKDLERAGHEAGEAARAKFLKALKKRKATPGQVALRLKQLMDWCKAKEKADNGKGQA